MKKAPKPTAGLSEISFPTDDVRAHPVRYIAAHHSVSGNMGYDWNKSKVEVLQGTKRITITAREFAAILFLKHQVRPDYIGAALQSTRNDAAKDVRKIRKISSISFSDNLKKAVLGLP